MRYTTLCYIENPAGEYLMLHRVKKENDCNRDKWIGIGGKFEDGESPEECALREIREETTGAGPPAGPYGPTPARPRRSRPGRCRSTHQR